MLIWSILSITGLGIAFRTFRICETHQLITQEAANRWRISVFLAITMIHFLLRNYLVALWITQFVIFLSPWWLVELLKSLRHKKLCDERIPILDFLISNMRSGHSLRTSLAEYGHHCKPMVGAALKEFITCLQFKKPWRSLVSHPQLDFFFEELSLIDGISHRQVDRLKILRQRLKTERNFRRKSSQATIQIRMQAWVMSLMYVGMLTYICLEFGFWSHSRLILMSTSLFLMGLILVLNIGRRYSWKI